MSLLTRLANLDDVLVGRVPPRAAAIAEIILGSSHYRIADGRTMSDPGHVWSPTGRASRVAGLTWAICTAAELWHMILSDVYTDDVRLVSRAHVARDVLLRLERVTHPMFSC